MGARSRNSDSNASYDSASDLQFEAVDHLECGARKETAPRYSREAIIYVGDNPSTTLRAGSILPHTFACSRGPRRAPPLRVMGWRSIGPAGLFLRVFSFQYGVPGAAIWRCFELKLVRGGRNHLNRESCFQGL